MVVVKVILIIILLVIIINKFIPDKDVNQITMDELYRQLNDDSKQYIDVRTPREFKLAHLEGFINIPLRRIRRHTDQISNDKELVVLCQTGIRSMEACKRLKRLGYGNLTNVKGGLSSWDRSDRKK